MHSAYLLTFWYFFPLNFSGYLNMIIRSPRLNIPDFLKNFLAVTDLLIWLFVHLRSPQFVHTYTVVLQKWSGLHRGKWGFCCFSCSMFPLLFPLHVPSSSPSFFFPLLPFPTFFSFSTDSIVPLFIHSINIPSTVDSY